MSTLTALRGYARARRRLTEVARQHGPGTEQHDHAGSDLVDAAMLVPERLAWALRVIDRRSYRQAGAVNDAPVYRARLRDIPAVLHLYADADRELRLLDIADYEAGIEWDTPAFLDADAAVTAAKASVPWWLLWLTTLIGNRIARQLDYFNLTGCPAMAPRLRLGWLALAIAAVTGAVIIGYTLGRAEAGNVPQPIPSVFCPAGQHVVTGTDGTSWCAR